MKKKAIRKMKKDIKAFKEKGIDHTQEELALYELSKTKGWEILVNKANEKCCKLLEPVDMKDVPNDSNHIVLLAKEFSKSETLEAFRELIDEVESIRIVKQREEIMQAEAKEKEVSKQKA